MPEFIKHPKCGTTATHCGDNSWYCPKCRDWFKHGLSEKEIRERSLAGWNVSEINLEKSAWPKQPRNSRQLPDHPE